MLGPGALSGVVDEGVDGPGETTRLSFAGIKHLGQRPWPTPAQMEKGYVTLINALHARHIHTLLGTIMPSGSALLDGPSTAPNLEANREAINAWIRSQHVSDGIVDFDKAMRDPQHPASLNPAYADGDFLPPAPAGYQAMANAVPLDALVAGCATGGDAPSPTAPAAYGTTPSQLVASLTALLKTKDNGYDVQTLATMLEAFATLGIVGF